MTGRCPKSSRDGDPDGQENARAGNLITEQRRIVNQMRAIASAFPGYEINSASIICLVRMVILALAVAAPTKGMLVIIKTRSSLSSPDVLPRSHRQEFSQPTPLSPATDPRRAKPAEKIGFVPRTKMNLHHTSP